ncbi:hypothetical protein EDC01DRAFT_60431 [Geopyxis carbonaria]|nr:hypothetical protein EDC01DRAFT_60431 [Geopyxis carbonaria]
MCCLFYGGLYFFSCHYMFFIDGVTFFLASCVFLFNFTYSTSLVFMFYSSPPSSPPSPPSSFTLYSILLYSSVFYTFLCPPLHRFIPHVQNCRGVTGDRATGQAQEQEQEVPS